MNLSLNVLEKLKLIQINFEIENKKWVGKFGLDLIPSNMDLKKFEKFFTKCFNKEPGYKYTYEIVGGLTKQKRELNEIYENCDQFPNQKLAELNKLKCQPIKPEPLTLYMELNAEMEFFNLTHKLTFKEFVHDEVFGVDFLQNAIQSIEAKLNKTITLINLKGFKLIDLKSDMGPFSYFHKHKTEFELSEQIELGKTKRLIGFEASSSKLDLSAFPYEFIKWNELANFYNLEELIINGQTSYKTWHCGSNEITDTIVWPDTVINIETINPNVKCLTINNIYRIEGELGCLDWAPELQELVLIGCKGSINILDSIKTCDKLKKIKLINCIPSIDGLATKSTSLGLTPIRLASYELRQDIPCSTTFVSPFLNSSYAIEKEQKKLQYDDLIEKYINNYDNGYESRYEYNPRYKDNKSPESKEYFTKLKKWCDEKKIELIISDYVDDEKVKKENFPYFSKVKGEKPVDIQIDYERAVNSLMTQMDPSGIASYPNVFEKDKTFNIDQVEGSNSNALYAQF